MVCVIRKVVKERRSGSADHWVCRFKWVFRVSLIEKETFEQILEDGEGPGHRDI